VSKTVLITGATSGLGLELAKLYAPSSRLLLLGRKPLAKLTDKLFHDHAYCQCDLSKPNCAEVVREWLEIEGITSLELVIHNAGMGYYGHLLKQSDKSVDELLAVNLYAPIRLTHALLPYLKNTEGLKNAKGKLVFISSVAANLPVADYSVYGASKAALGGLARNLRLELDDIKVQTIYPGAIQTELHLKSGATNVKTKNFPTAEHVARDVVKAIATHQREVTIGFKNKLLRKVGYYASGLSDVIARSRVTTLSKTTPVKTIPVKTTTAPAKKCCVITGAASGIGAALADVFKNDYEIIGIDRDFVSAKKVMNKLGAEAEVRFIIAELTSQAGRGRIVSELKEPVDILIHSAGINAVGRFESSDIQTQLAVLEVNLRSPLLLTKALLANGVLKRGSTIIFIASLSHFVAYPGASVYAASKDGLTSFARSLSVALKPEGIHVLTVFPGPTRTPHARQHSPDNRRENARMLPEVLAQKIRGAMGNKRHRYVPGLQNKLFAALGQWLPSVTEGWMKKAILDKLASKAKL
jgi:short-subunit dehydrogenase